MSCFVKVIHRVGIQTFIQFEKDVLNKFWEFEMTLSLFVFSSSDRRQSNFYSDVLVCKYCLISSITLYTTHVNGDLVSFKLVKAIIKQVQFSFIKCRFRCKL